MTNAPLELKISGLAELDRAIGELSEKLARNVIRGALRAAAKPIADEAFAIAPVRTGRLAATIRVTSKIRYGVPEASVKAGSRVRGGGGAFYAHMVEKGTKAHEIRPKKGKSLFIAGLNRTLVKHPGAQERRYLRGAAERRQAAAVEAFADYCRKRLAKEGIAVPDPEPETE